MGEPSSALFPLPEQGMTVAEPVFNGVNNLSYLELILEAGETYTPLGVVVFCLVVYTRLVKGLPINPLKWIGWARTKKR